MNQTVKWALSAATAALVTATPAHAEVWDWSFTSGTRSATGQIDILGDGSSAESVQWITGTYSDPFVTGAAITGLDASLGNGFFNWDNLFGGANFLSQGGLGFTVSGLPSAVNLWYENNQYWMGTYKDGYSYNAGTFEATLAVPEPESYALMLAGLGALAVVRRRRVQR